MIKFTWEHINANHMDPTLRKLMGTQFNNIKLSHDIHVICTKLLKAIDEKRKVYSAKVKELAEKDENGNVALDQFGGPKIPVEKEAEMEAATKELLAGELEIEKHPIQFQLLDKALLTPNEVAAILPMITGLDS